jgi:hyperosmotically inducible periplasmic protein
MVLVAMMMAVSPVGCAGTGAGGPQRPVGQVVDHAAIGTKLKAALAADPALSALKINVDSAEGRVRLRGEVKTISRDSRARQSRAQPS